MTKKQKPLPALRVVLILLPRHVIVPPYLPHRNRDGPKADHTILETQLRHISQKRRVFRVGLTGFEHASAVHQEMGKDIGMGVSFEAGAE
jgi:hypothetical protein